MRRAVLASMAFALLAAGCTSGERPQTVRVVSSPIPTATPMPTPEPTPTLRPPTPKPVKPPVRPVATRPAGDASAFHGLGAWVDVFDINDDPATLVPHIASMKQRGVRTLYLETSRFNRALHIENPRTVAAALEEAHRLGLKVVAWYPPDFVDVDREVERSLAAVRYVSPNGHRFDAFGADIERTDVKDTAERNRRLLDYTRRLRAGAGAVPLAAITYPPSGFDRNTTLWPSFPWAELAATYDVFMPMSYWTYRGADVATASGLTQYNLEQTRRLTGRPVHIIGGEAAKIDEAQAAAYAAKATAGGSIGGSVYDYATTHPSVWDELAAVNG